MNAVNASKFPIAAVLVWVLAACGGGRGSAPEALAPLAAHLPSQASSAASIAFTKRAPFCPKGCLSGTAARGSAVANATVTITDSTGLPACQQSPVVTDAFGKYTCTLNAGATAPFFVVVTDPTGNTQPMVSVATTVPGGGGNLTVNATPLTTAILASISPDGNPMSLVASRTVDTTALADATTAVVAQLSPVLTALNVPSGYDPFTTTIAAATPSNTGSTTDQVLDVVQVVTDPGTGVVSLSTIGSTDVVPVGSPQPLQPPPSNISSLAQAQQKFAAQLTQCFALPVADRALATDTTIPASQGGSAVTSMAAACSAFAASTSNGAGVSFLHSGYSFGQLMFSRLTSNGMTSATFAVPEIMLYLPGDANASPPTTDRAILNFRYVTTAGNPGNIIVNASNLVSAPTPGWWITGNGDPVDVNIRPVVRLIVQANPAIVSGLNVSHFQSGFTATINAQGPNSVVNNEAMAHARISGPGLPAAGMVFISPIPSEVGQTYMDLSNVTGTVPSSDRCGGQFLNCPLFWLNRSVGVSGAAATQLSANQNSPIWWQPATPLAPGTLAKGNVYTIEIFYGAATSPTYILKRPLLTSMVQSTLASGLYWNTLGPTSTALLDPANATYNGTLNFPVTLDWVQNPSAEQISTGAITINGTGTFGTAVNAAPGATSLVFPTPNSPPLTTLTQRQLLFNYRMLDGSSKSMSYRYN